MFNRKIKNARAQTSLEYAVIIACIVAALLAMQVYVKRGIAGKLRSAADDIGQQYDPGNTTGDMTIELTSNVTTEVETIEENGTLQTSTTVTTNSEVEERYGTEIVGELDSSLF